MAHEYSAQVPLRDKLIDVKFTYLRGSPQTYWQPADPDEIEIVSPDLSEEDYDRVETWLHENWSTLDDKPDDDYEPPDPPGFEGGFADNH
jgi:hypothetical protein